MKKFIFQFIDANVEDFLCFHLRDQSIWYKESEFGYSRLANNVKPEPALSYSIANPSMLF